LPDWVVLDDQGDGTASLQIDPGYDDAGSYQVAVTVDDGEADASTSFELTVTDTTQPPSGGSGGSDGSDDQTPDTDVLPELMVKLRSIDYACPEGLVPSGGFADVAPTNTHERSIRCISWWDVVRGVSDDSYAPSLSVTRGQMSTFIANVITASGGNLPSEQTSTLSDVNGTTHEAAIAQLVAADIVVGIGDGRFAPNAVVTRAQMATFIARAYEYVIGAPLPEADEDAFDDDDGSLHEVNINRIAGAGLAAGTGGGNYEPYEAVSRDQMASFIARLLDAVAEEFGLQLPA